MDKTPQKAMYKEATSGAPTRSWRPSADREPGETLAHQRRPRFSLRRNVPDTEKGRKRPNNDGDFDGSFAGTASHRTDAYVLPWYLRSQYFTDGLTDTSIWRAAVSASLLCCAVLCSLLLC